ncbi:MAG: hypothetical protein E7653_01205 [Ruminococcaceae bacterium]|nr:hypothetical protein [Oscillospiraceae bacterium]
MQDNSYNSLEKKLKENSLTCASVLEKYLTELENDTNGIPFESLKETYYIYSCKLISALESCELVALEASRQIISSDAANDREAVADFEKLLDRYILMRKTVEEYLTDTETYLSNAGEKFPRLNIMRCAEITLRKIVIL